MGDQASIVSEISATFLDEKDYILLSKERQGRRYFFYYHNRTVDDGLCTPRYSHSPPCKMLLASRLLQDYERISTANVEMQHEYCLVLTGRRRCIQAEASEGRRDICTTATCNKRDLFELATRGSPRCPGTSDT